MQSMTKAKLATGISPKTDMKCYGVLKKVLKKAYTKSRNLKLSWGLVYCQSMRLKLTTEIISETHKICSVSELRWIKYPPLETSEFTSIHNNTKYKQIYKIKSRSETFVNLLNVIFSLKLNVICKKMYIKKNKKELNEVNTCGI